MRVCGRPSNIAVATGSFDINVNQWVSFQSGKVIFPWTGTFLRTWKSRPTLNQNNPKFLWVTGVLDSMRGTGASRRFHVDIMSLTFLGSAPFSHRAQRVYLLPSSAPQTNLPCSIDPDPREEEEDSHLFRRSRNADQAQAHLNH